MHFDEHECGDNGGQLETLFHGFLTSLAHKAEFLESYLHGLRRDEVALSQLLERVSVRLAGKRDFRHKEGHRTQKSDLLNVGFSHSWDDPCDDA